MTPVQTALCVAGRTQLREYDLSDTPLSIFGTAFFGSLPPAVPVRCAGVADVSTPDGPGLISVWGVASEDALGLRAARAPATCLLFRETTKH
jgi:hypothetical protein